MTDVTKRQEERCIESYWKCAGLCPYGAGMCCLLVYGYIDTPRHSARPVPGGHLWGLPHRSLINFSFQLQLLFPPWGLWDWG